MPGLKQGILASSDCELVATLRRSVAIWNINSFAEFFMQIAEKYRNDYYVSLEKIRQQRSYLTTELNKIDGIRVVPSQANFIMLELSGSVAAPKLTKKLLVNYNIFIKDLSGKISPLRNSKYSYVRVAVRDENDNQSLVKAITQIIAKAN